jgi:hypothetical protein
MPEITQDFKAYPLVVSIDGKYYISTPLDQAHYVIGAQGFRQLHNTPKAVDVELPAGSQVWGEPAPVELVQACLAQRPQSTDTVTALHSAELRTCQDGSQAVVIECTRWLSVRQLHRDFHISCQF